MSNREATEELVRLVAQLQRERTAAVAIVEHLVASFPKSDPLDREIPPEWQTLGLADVLTRTASDHVERDSRAALSLAQLSLVVLGSLDGGYPPVLVRQALAASWRTIAVVHNYRSEYRAAHRALDAAESYVADVHALGHDRAKLNHVRACTFSLEGAYERARPLLEQAFDVFMEHRDVTSATKCLVERGTIEKRQGLLTEAANSYEVALAMMGSTPSDLHTLAVIHNNLGQVRMELGQPARAATSLEDALGLFSALEMTGEVVRLKHYLGKVLIASGN